MLFQKVFLSNDVKNGWTPTFLSIVDRYPCGFFFFSVICNNVCLSYCISYKDPETQEPLVGKFHCSCVLSRFLPSRTREIEMPVATWKVFYHPAVLWWTAAKIEEHTKQEEIVNQSVNECERKMSCLIIENRFTEGQSSYAKKL